MTRIACASMLVIAAVLFATDARAALITWQLGGTVLVNPAYETELASLGVVDGTPYTAVIVFDSNTPPSYEFGDPQLRVFHDAVLSLEFHAGAYDRVLTSGIDSKINATDSFNYYGLVVWDEGGSPVLTLESIDNWANPAGFPIDLPQEGFSGAYPGFHLYVGSGPPAALFAPIDSYVRTVPEPASALLLGVGVALALRLRR